MPIYEYHCDSCEQRMEKIQKHSEPPLKTCPSCGEDALRKLVSAAAFKLTGTGWYETDFKDKPKGKESEKGGSTGDSASKKDSDKKSDAGKTSGASSDSKSNASKSSSTKSTSNPD